MDPRSVAPVVQHMRVRLPCDAQRSSEGAARLVACEKKVNNLGRDGDPDPVFDKKRRHSARAPTSRRSGLVGPHTTPAIVDYKYMTSTL